MDHERLIENNTITILTKQIYTIPFLKAGKIRKLRIDENYSSGIINNCYNNDYTNKQKNEGGDKMR